MTFQDYLKGIFKQEITVKVVDGEYDYNNPYFYSKPQFLFKSQAAGTLVIITGMDNNLVVVDGASVSNSTQKVEPYYTMDMKRIPAVGPKYVKYISPKCSISAGAGDYGCALGPLAKKIVIPPDFQITLLPGGGAVGTDTWYIRYYLVPLPGGQ